MSLTLYYHPLSSFCMKVLVALYENDTPFTPHLVDLGNAESRADFLKLWPMGKFPVLRDESRDTIVPESTTIIEYLAQYYPGQVQLVPADPDFARQTRLRDRFFDLYLNQGMQRIVDQLLREPAKRDQMTIDDAERRLATAYDVVDGAMAEKVWAMGDTFTMADCAAAPALLYANAVLPFGDERKNVAAYLERLMERLSFARAVKESQPYTHLLPMKEGYFAAYGERLRRP